MIPKALIVLAFVCAVFPACSGREPDREEIRALREKIQAAPPPFALDGRGDLWNITRQLYEAREFRPVWIARGRRLPKVEQIFGLLEDRSHGFDPDDFNIEALRGESPDPVDFDVMATYTLVRYASALAFGRTNPRSIDPNWIATRPNIDIRQVLVDSIQSGTISQLAERLAPPHREYAQLRNALGMATGDERRQIELNLERWRWLPEDLGHRHIRVNIPSFELQVHDSDQIPITMRIVVGTNEDRTPVFSSRMKHLVFSPYWNIPESIATEETLPAILRDPDYISRQNIEVVRVSEHHIQVLEPEDVDWENLRGSGIQLRQKPGGPNSLGLVKFMFPNRFNVYLHDTPSDNLFARLTRAFSHGCVRLERPAELASYLLRDQPEWTSERIEKAMHAREEKHVALKDEVPVHIVYFTAWIDESGNPHFENDVYGYDARQRQIEGR